MMLNALTREELFLLVWERPSQEIAKELGISDVALEKRCKKLQGPNPPQAIGQTLKPEIEQSTSAECMLPREP